MYFVSACPGMMSGTLLAGWWEGVQAERTKPSVNAIILSCWEGAVYCKNFAFLQKQKFQRFCENY